MNYGNIFLIKYRTNRGAQASNIYAETVDDVQEGIKMLQDNYWSNLYDWERNPHFDVIGVYRECLDIILPKE